MVYIHGGGFYSGSANFIHPTYVMDHPVVVVVIQYRLGILGINLIINKSDCTFQM